MGATFGTLMLTWLRGELVGADAYGNRYYKLRGDKWARLGGGRGGRQRRWVIYNGEAEGSKVPAEWHAWLHHMVDELPQPRERHPWEKDHQANMTGTKDAYHPSGSVLRGGHRVRATGDYEPWSPE